MLDNLEKAGFSKVSAKKFFCIREFSAEDYRDLLTTYSDHMALERDRREMLMSGVQKAVQRYGKVTIDYTLKCTQGLRTTATACKLYRRLLWYKLYCTQEVYYAAPNKFDI